MAYTGDPLNNPSDELRLNIGDTDPVMPLLTDQEVTYFLTRNNDSVRRASVDAAKTILFKLSSYIRERVDVLEYYGSDYFKQYAAALKMYISDPNFSTAIQGAMPYAGGISRSDIEANLSNSDNYTVPFENSIPNDNWAYNIHNDSPFKK